MRSPTRTPATAATDARATFSTTRHRAGSGAFVAGFAVRERMRVRANRASFPVPSTRSECHTSIGLRTDSAGIDPFLERIDEGGVREGRQRPLSARRPAPEDERVVPDVLEE